MRTKMFPTAVATAALSGLVLAASLTPTATASPSVARGRHDPGTHVPRPDLSQKVTGERVFRHLEELQEIADENGGNRAAGTQGDRKSVV